MEFKKGDKCLIQYGFNVHVAEIITVVKGKHTSIIEYIFSFYGLHLGIIARLFSFYMKVAETQESFESKLI